MTWIMNLLDYETLRVLWWILIGIFFTGFTILDGFDLGIAMGLPWLTHTEMERKILIRCSGPTWEGSQVWFILGGGALFVAWPLVYAVSFSSFSLAIILVLFALILRPVSFKCRSKINNPRWRTLWDIALFISGFVPALIFGVAIGNVLQGIPFHFGADLHLYYTGTLSELLNPFALLCGLLTICIFIMHGSLFASVKTEGHLQQSAQNTARITASLTAVLFIAGGIWLALWGDGYQLLAQSAPSLDTPSNPLFKAVSHEAGAWFIHYEQYPWTTVAPLLGMMLPLLATILVRFPKIAFLCSTLSIISIIATVGISMFPFIVPSSTVPDHSLTVWDSASSALTLLNLFFVALLVLPVIIGYTVWVYRVLRGKITVTSSLFSRQDECYIANME